MSELAQHILTWKCSNDESDEIQKAVQACEDKGKFKEVCPTPWRHTVPGKTQGSPSLFEGLVGAAPRRSVHPRKASASRMDAEQDYELEPDSQEQSI